MDDGIYDARATVQRGLVLAIDDSGQAQTATIQATNGAIYSAVEVWQPFGSASVPPTDGAIAILIALGGDPANMVALLANPSHRFGAQNPGDQGIYAADGGRVVCQADGSVVAKAAMSIILSAPTVTIVTALGEMAIGAAGITLTGPTTLTGDLHVVGNITATGTIG